MRTGIDGYVENNGENLTYCSARNAEVKIILELLKKGYKIEFAKHNWITINGRTFNGWNKQLLERAGIKYESN